MITVEISLFLSSNCCIFPLLFIKLILLQPHTFQTREFKMQKNKNVDIRVGIHTGIVLCGIVGGTKFKYGKKPDIDGEREEERGEEKEREREREISRKRECMLVNFTILQSTQ